MHARKKSADSADSPGPSKPSGRSAVVYDILRTAIRIRRAYPSIFEGCDITLQQYNVLRILRGASPQGLPTLEIAERMIEDTPGITRLLDRLEAKQLIRRERPRNNRRQVICQVSEKGLELLDKLDEPVRNRNKMTIRRLSDADVKVLVRCLERIREDCHPQPAENKCS